MVLFEDILKDNTSGSVEILNKITDLFYSAFRYQKIVDLNIVKEQLDTLLKKYPQFLALKHFVDHFRNKLKESDNTNVLIQFLENYKMRWNNIGVDLAKNILNELNLNGKSILLHSNSYTIYQLFEALKNMNVNMKLFQTASAPVNEGKIQAEKLAQLGYVVNFITEASIAKFLRDINYVFLGADVILDHRFLNKTGSLQIALTAKYFNKAVYVIADSRKYLRNESRHSELISLFADEKIKPADELWMDPPGKIEVLNYYFEFIPNNLVKKFFFERNVNL
jgi:translation initiation factor 2B subunit (eIF-2B alpha/beta/delta family)